MRSIARLLFVLSLISSPCLAQRAVASTAQATPATVPMVMAVDATDLPRQLLRATIELPATSQVTVVRYPEWIPGTHAPTRQLSNVAGFEVTDLAGKPLQWVRDPIDRHYFRIETPAGTQRVRIKLRYICNQPNENSEGVDCFGHPRMGIICWNSLTLYPAGTPAASVVATVSLTMPPGWTHGSAMRTRLVTGNTVHFQPADLESVIDRPLFCGEFLRTVALPVKNAPPHRIHFMSDVESQLRLEDSLKEKLTSMVEETAAFLGGYPYDSYDFLIGVTESFPRIGLEHTDSSISVTAGESLVEEKTRKRDFDYLVSHEFAHAWCGKYRRPQAMIVPDFNTPEQTELLWCYEGFTQFVSWIVPSRCGLQDKDDFLQEMAFGLERMMSQQGRLWRPLEDTAAASFTLRAGSRSWGNLRRSQDYYQEGALMWMEIDSILRHETLGEKSLTDFTKSFFARKKEREKGRGTRVVGYTFDEIAEELNKVRPRDWKAFLTERTRRTQKALPTEFLQKAGYRLAYSPQRSELLKDIERTWGRGGWSNLNSSLGFSIGDDGRVSSVVPGGPGEKAGLFDGSKVVAVDGRAFNRARMNDAVERSVSTKAIALIVQEGDMFRTVSLDYSGGQKFLKLERDDAYADGIAKLLEPLVKKDEKKEK